MRRWVPRDIDVKDLTTGVLDNEETGQQLRVDRRNGEGVEGDNRSSVIRQKRQPTFPRITPPSNTPQIAGDTAFGNDKAEFLQLTINLGRSPIRILIGQAPDQGRASSAILGRPRQAGSSNASTGGIRRDASRRRFRA
jgi:hypothetical protein